METIPAAPIAPAKKSSTPLIIAVIVAAILSLCCCCPGIINLISPIPYTAVTTGIIGESETTGTIPGYFGIFCLCAALIPWVVVLILALVRRPKKS